MPVAVNYDTQTEDLNTNLYPGAKFTGEQKSNKQKYMGKNHIVALKYYNRTTLNFLLQLRFKSITSIGSSHIFAVVWIYLD